MGFSDDIGVGGGKPLLKFDGKEAIYKTRNSEEILNDQEYVAKIREAVAGYIKFSGGDRPERRLGAIYPKDEAPPLLHSETPIRPNGPRGSLATNRQTPGRR